MQTEPFFEKLDISWRLVRRDGTVITPENLPAGVSTASLSETYVSFVPSEPT